MEDIRVLSGADRKVGVVLGLWAGVVAIPLFIAGPQLLVGSVVNALLFIASTRMDKKSLLLMAVLPSSAAVAHGMLFGGLTSFLVFLMPFIWVGNGMLMMINRRVGKIGGVVVASVVKASWLFGSAWLLNKLGVVPVAMVTLMGVGQLTTALVGGVGANLIEKKYGRS